MDFAATDLGLSLGYALGVAVAVILPVLANIWAVRAWRARRNDRWSALVFAVLGWIFLIWRFT